MKSLIFLLALFLPSATASPAADTPASIYDFTMKTIDGEDRPLADYKGKVLLVVNTASRCGFTPQYKGLEALYQDYKDKGFEVLAFPANNFMGQEPGTNSEIKEFCALTYKTTFPLFAKISVKGDDMAPLYQYLTTQAGHNGDISWNFNKFLVDRNGKVVDRFGSKTDPQDEAVVAKIRELLAS
jgi:glutathione peroxidase